MRARIPGRLRTIPIFQLSSYECGVACLTMLLQHLGEPTTLEEIRAECGIGRDGISALTMIKVARSHGFIAKAYGMSLDDLKRFTHPLILHWRFQHFVVLEGINKNKVHIVDPARGRIVVDLEELSDSYTGVALSIFRDTAMPVRRNRHRPLHKAQHPTLLSMVTKLKLPRDALFSLMLATLVAQIAATALPLLARYALNAAERSVSVPNTLRSAFICLFLCLSCLGISSLLRNCLLVSIRHKINYFLSSTFLSHIVSLPVGFLLNRDTGDLLLRLESNGRLRDVFAGLIVSSLIDIAFMTSYVGALFFWRLGFFYSRLQLSHSMPYSLFISRLFRAQCALLRWGHAAKKMV